MAEPNPSPQDSTKGTSWSRKSHGRSSQWDIHRKGDQIFYVRNDGEIVKVPPSGPSNTIVLTGSLIPFPKDTGSEQG